jgi:hypothetical protein
MPTPVTKVKEPSEEEIEARRILALTMEIAELFKAIYKRGPWPNEIQCYPLAVIIGVIRNNESDKKSYKKDFERDNRPLRKRRAFVKKMKQYVTAQQTLGPSISLQEAEALGALETALEKATSALLAPFDPLAGERNKAWWHKAARTIAEQAETALIQAGHKNLSKQKHGAFVKVVADLLKLATGEDFEPVTIAHVLTNFRQLSLAKLVG